MPRPAKEGLVYFSHDVDASSDEKIEALTSLFGAEGYAFYFILCERIYRTNTGDMDVSDAETIQILARKCLTTKARFIRMMKVALKVGLFDKQEYESRKVLTSNGIKKRAQTVIAKREKARESYKKSVSDSETRQISVRNTPEGTQSKVKESKEKDLRSTGHARSQELPGSDRVQHESDPKLVAQIIHDMKLPLTS